MVKRSAIIDDNYVEVKPTEFGRQLQREESCMIIVVSIVIVLATVITFISVTV